MRNNFLTSIGATIIGANNFDICTNHISSDFGASFGLDIARAQVTLTLLLLVAGWILGAKLAHSEIFPVFSPLIIDMSVVVRVRCRCEPATDFSGPRLVQGFVPLRLIFGDICPLNEPELIWAPAERSGAIWLNEEADDNNKESHNKRLALTEIESVNGFSSSSLQQ